MSGLSQVTGVILAGGRATRMGGKDKGLVILKGQPLYQHIIEKLAPQVGQLVISANRNIEIYESTGLTVLSDSLADYPGPLAGMVSVMEKIDSDWFLFCPCDTPNIPRYLACHLWHEKGPSPVVWVREGEKDHPTLALLHRRIVPQLKTYLAEGERRVLTFFKSTGGHGVTFTNAADCFVNINTPDDLHYLENASPL